VSLAVPDDNLTARQRAALESLAASHPRPRTSAQLAAELHVAEGALNVTLRSLRRGGLIVAVAATARARGGWTLSRPR
jgi:DNA-binding IscR family transcriptional regulator